MSDGGDEFRRRSAEYRLAWAAAADWRAAVDLLRAQRTRARRMRLTRAAAIAGIVAGLGVVAWAMDGQPRQASAPSRTSPAQPPVRRQPREPQRIVARAPGGALTPPLPPLLPLTSISENRRPDPTKAVTLAPVVAAERRPREVRQPPETPFEASLETILYSANRRLALIDGRIVQMGDVVGRATIVDITPTAVLLRDSAGRPRTISLEGRR